MPSNAEAMSSGQCGRRISLKFLLRLPKATKVAAATATRMAERLNGVIRRRAILAGIPQVPKITWTAKSARCGPAGNCLDCVAIQGAASGEERQKIVCGSLSRIGEV